MASTHKACYAIDIELTNQQRSSVKTIELPQNVLLYTGKLNVPGPHLLWENNKLRESFASIRKQEVTKNLLKPKIGNMSN